MSSARRRRNARQSWPPLWRPQRASTSAAPTNIPWPRGCGAGTTSTPSQMSVAPRRIAAHLHPRYSPEAGRGRTNNGQLHNAGDVSQSKREERTEYPSAHLLPFLRISACGSGCGSKLTRPLTHESNPPKSKEKVLFSLENRTFWSCWADSNRRPHPYQCEQRLFTAFHKLSKSLISSRFSDFPSRALSFPLIPSNSNKEQIKNKRGSNLGASFCTGAEHHNLLCNDLQIKAYPAGICICNQAVPVHNVKTQSTVLNREIAFTVKDRHLRE